MIRLAALAGALIALIAVPSAAEERILDFDSVVEIGADGVLTVTERITVEAEGQRIKRGIYRDFPTSYERPGFGRHKVGFEVLGVRRGGRPENWFTEGLSNGVRVYMGRKEVRLRPGRHTYELTYRTDRQLGYFAEFDELYWNVTGNDWAFTIDRARITILLPPGAQAVRSAAYTGAQGAQGRNWLQLTDGRGNPVFETTRKLLPGEGLTVAMAWPKGHVVQPDVATELRWWLQDLLPFVAGAAAVLAVLAYYLLVWSRVGRDPAGGVVIPRWQPPKGVSPAAARYLSRMDFDKKAIGAAIVSLAVKGRLTIEDDDGGDYRLRRRKPVVGPALSRGERALEKALFLWDSVATISKGNHERLQPAVNALKSVLYDRHDEVHFRRNFGFFIFGGLITLFAGLGAGIPSANAPETSGVVALVVTVVSLLGLNVLFYRLLKAPTAEGRRILDEIEGFRMYLATAEKERLNVLNPPDRTPELFEQYLPYAMALDVEHEWAEQFQDVLAAATAGREGDWQPDWYHGGRGWDHGRSPAGFTETLGASLGGAVAAAATPPGSSSGSGGGGSSGGGGGGGGGGGW